MKDLKDIYELFGINKSSTPKKVDNGGQINDADKASADLASYIESKREEMKQAEAEEARRLEDERIEEITSMDLPTDFENIWTLDDSGTLTISGTGDMADYNTTTTTPWCDLV